MMKNHDQKATVGGKGLFGIHFQVKVPHQMKSENELKAGADAESVGECCLLACFSWLA